MPSAAILFPVCAGLALLLILVAALRRRVDESGFNMPARVFLVLLRVAIGWHLLVEGLEKFKSPNWSSEPYLRESVGPFAAKFRAIAGDSVAEQLTLDADQKFPVALASEWQRWADAFEAHHKLDDKQAQAAKQAFDQAKSATLTWLKKPKSVEKRSPYPPTLWVEWDVAQRLEEYAKLQAKVEEVEQSLPSKGPAVWASWKEAKADVAKYRAELKSDLDGQTAAMKKAVADAAKLTSEQKAGPPLREPLPRPFRWNSQLDVSDAIVKYGLVVAGGCMICGAFTPLACLVGAFLLAMFYVAMPAMPYLPDLPKSEGHYVYVNKVIVEMLALLALAFLPTGRWVGADGLLQYLNPLRRSPSAPAAK